MSKRSEFIAIVLVLLSTVGTVLGVLGIEKYRRSKLYTIEILARTPRNGNWHPRQVMVPYGQNVKILIRNVETVSHGFALPAFDIGVGEIKAGEVAVIRFTPNKRGRFPFMCTVWCSDEHLEMNGEIIVE